MKLMALMFLGYTAKVSMKYMTYCPSCDSIDITPWMQLWIDINCYGAGYFLM